MTHKANGEMSFIGTAMVFLVAGFDTTGMTLSWICYELEEVATTYRRRWTATQPMKQLEGKLQTSTTSRDSPFSTS